MTGSSSRVPLLLALVWLGGLLAATSVGLLAVRLVAEQVGDPAVAPLSAVAAASAAAAPSQAAPAAPTVTAAPPPGTAAPTAVPAPASRTFTTAAGTVGVSCTGTVLRLRYATPAQGYALDERSVAGAVAEVRFEGGGTRVRVRLSCADGAPRLVEQRTDPDGGGGDDGDAEDGPDDSGDDD